MIAQMGAHLAAEAQDDADSSDSDSEDDDDEETHRSRGRGGAGGAGSVGSGEEKRGSLSPAGSRHSSGELYLTLLFDS